MSRQSDILLFFSRRALAHVVWVAVADDAFNANMDFIDDNRILIKNLYIFKGWCAKKTYWRVSSSVNKLLKNPKHRYSSKKRQQTTSNCADIKWRQTNSTTTNPRCHGNEIWDKIGYNSACVRDISEMFSSNRGFSGSGYWMTPYKFYHDQPPLPWQQNLGPNRL